MITRDVAWCDLPSGKKPCWRGTDPISFIPPVGRKKNNHEEIDDDDGSETKDMRCLSIRTPRILDSFPVTLIGVPWHQRPHPWRSPRKTPVPRILVLLTQTHLLIFLNNVGSILLRGSTPTRQATAQSLKTSSNVFARTPQRPPTTGPDG